MRRERDETTSARLHCEDGDAIENDGESQIAGGRSGGP